MKFLKITGLAVTGLLAAIILILVVGFAFLKYNERNPNPHNIEYMARKNKLYNGYRPFLDKDITKVCFPANEDDLKKYSSKYQGEYYDYVAIAEFRGQNINVGFVKDYRITYRNLSPNAEFCTNKPEQLVVRPYHGSWIIKVEDK